MTSAPAPTVAREARATGAWQQAYASWIDADQLQSLGPEELQLLAESCYMLGLDDEYVDALERAHHAHLDSGRGPAAARCAFWIGHNRMFRGDTAQALGWFARAGRALEPSADDCVEQGYLLIPRWLQEMGSGDYAAGYETAGAAGAIAERFGDRDLQALARDDQGRALVKQGRIQEGLRLVDELLVAATAGELTPVVTGIVYCNTIAFCQDVFELRHAREWLKALTDWCDRQPEMVAHNGLCLVHRAEILQVLGAWDEALDEAQRAATQYTAGILNQIAGGKARYQQGEVHRLRGAYSLAETAYQDAHRRGYEPLPGLALLRLARGDAAGAAATLRRAVTERALPLERAGLLAAYVSVMLAAGEPEAAAEACRELDETATACSSEWLAAQAARASGELLLGRDDASVALPALRRASRLWLELDAPYDVACTRVLLAEACRALGDEEGAHLELEAARETFAELGARPDLERIGGAAPDEGRHGLTGREIEVLRLVKAGRGNREIAAALTISEHTVARHVQNIFGKLGVSTRSAATAYAFEHDLG